MEFKPQVIYFSINEVLKLTFISERSDHSAAIPVTEERFKQTADAIILRYTITKPLLYQKSSF